MKKSLNTPEQLTLGEDLAPIAEAPQRGGRARTAGATAPRPQSIWAHESSGLDPATNSAAVLRRDPDWVAKTLADAQRGTIQLTLDDAITLCTLLDEQYVYEATNYADLEDVTTVTLKDKRRRALALARARKVEIEDLHIPLCSRAREAMTSHTTSRWLLDALASALTGDLLPAMAQAEQLATLYRRNQKTRIQT